MRFSLLIAAALLALSSGCRAAAQEPAGAGSATAVAASAEASAPAAPAGACNVGADSLALPASGGACDEKQCAAAGGACTFGGFACKQVCARRTRDGAKPCRDGNECEAGCFGPSYLRAGAPAAGTCASLYVNRGCKNAVEKGVARGTLCAE
jgi:hypothetical protein